MGLTNFFKTTIAAASVFALALSSFYLVPQTNLAAKISTVRATTSQVNTSNGQATLTTNQKSDGSVQRIYKYDNGDTRLVNQDAGYDPNCMCGGSVNAVQVNADGSVSSWNVW